MIKVLSLLLLVFLVDLNAAFACSCSGPWTPINEMNNADAVFSGVVTDISLSEDSEKKVTFDVDRTWKGNNDAIISVSTSVGGGSCGISYEVGQAWLVYAGGKNGLSTDSCSRTTKIENAQEDLKALGAGKIAPPAPPRQSKTIWIAFVLFIGAMAAGILTRFKQRQ